MKSRVFKKFSTEKFSSQQTKVIPVSFSSDGFKIFDLNLFVSLAFPDLFLKLVIVDDQRGQVGQLSFPANIPGSGMK